MKKMILALVLAECALAAGAQDMQDRPSQPSEAQCKKILQTVQFKDLTDLDYLRLTRTGMVINLCRKYPSQKAEAEAHMGWIAIESNTRMENYLERHGLFQDFAQEDEQGKR